MAAAPITWAPASWREFPVGHAPGWPDDEVLAAAVAELAAMPPLVFAGEARTLLAQLATVIEGRAFVLQAGDCAESFRDFSAISIREKLKIILQMSAVLTYATGLPIIKIGRIAGQFTKPRSSPVEVIDGVELPSFKGHTVHDDAPNLEARTPDPRRMVRGYHQAAATLNLLRAFTRGGFADITQVHNWNLEFVAASPEGRRYAQLAAEIERALGFMRACGIDLASEPRLREVEFFTSHEALLLDYEQGLTRRDSLTGDWYDCSAHMVWIGERTRELGGAHVHYVSGVGNPIGVKIGAKTTAEEVVALAEAINPDRVPGRLTFVARLGAELVPEALPPLIRALADAEHPVVWLCDPMHANGFKTASGIKTRRLSDVLAEVESFFHVCREEEVWPGGVHLEFTGEDVTECLGGSLEVLEAELDRRYETLCDPRLNGRQALDLAFRVAELVRS